MLVHGSIRYKLYACGALLLVIVSLLALSGLHGSYAYRGLSISISQLARESQLASNLDLQVKHLRDTLQSIFDAKDQSRSNAVGIPFPDTRSVDFDDISPGRLSNRIQAVAKSLALYERHISQSEKLTEKIGDYRLERQAINSLQGTVATLLEEDAKIKSFSPSGIPVDALIGGVDLMRIESQELPISLNRRMREYRDQVRQRYRRWIGYNSAVTLSAFVMGVLLLRLIYCWLLKPLRTLIHGSRRVAAGDFEHRIHLVARDEIQELAQAMNDMTDRFQEIRDDLDLQVRQRTLEVVRTEQLASVGVLAAGVAHEINNPLASIAFCAESLESRLVERANSNSSPENNGGDADVLVSYSKMIQEEAFRCKEITERLLDFSRPGNGEKESANLVPIVQSVIDIVHHLGKYREKKIDLFAPDTVVAHVNEHEMKQVVLNLVTNSLEAIESNGQVHIALTRFGDEVRLVISDDGCGMDAEVLKHLFEPFFTKRVDGSGTGLGLAIAYRIISDHDGRIVAESQGPGLGSQFSVRLPARHENLTSTKRIQAA